MIKYAPGCNAACRSAGDCNCPTPEKTQWRALREFMEDVKKRLPSPHQEHRPTLVELHMSLWYILRDLRWAISWKGDIATLSADLASVAAQIAMYEEMSRWYPRSRT